MIKLTFKHKIRAAFLVTIFVAGTIGLASNTILKSIKNTSLDFSFRDTQDLIDAESLNLGIERTVASGRAFLLSEDKQYLVRLGNFESTTQTTLERLVIHVENEKTHQLLGRLQTSFNEYVSELNRLVQMRNQGRSLQIIIDDFEKQLHPKQLNLESNIQELITLKKAEYEAGERHVLQSFSRSRTLIFYISAISLLFAGVLAFVFSQTLVRLYSKARDAAIVREEVLAVVAHDLKNPLASIQLNTQMQLKLLKSGVNETTLEKSFQMIARSARNMESLIQDLLTAARFSVDEVILEKEPVMISELLKDLTEELKPIANVKRITLVENLKIGESKIICDSKRIWQVASNILGNAIKFSPQDSFITLSAEPGNHELEIAVSDQGPGIPEDQLPYVFDRFKQAHREDARNGSGLGLYISKKIIEAHGGRIWAETSNKQGSTFHFTLPMS